MIVAAVLGALVWWSDPVTGEAFCGRVTHLEEVRRVAWIMPRLTPYSYAIVHVDLLHPGCPK